MNEEIGTMAGAIWQALDSNGEMTLARLKKDLKAKGPVFDWAIGWLAREDKILLTRDQLAMRVCLKGWQEHSAHAA